MNQLSHLTRQNAPPGSAEAASIAPPITDGHVGLPTARQGRIRADFHQGMGKVRGKFAIILDLDHIAEVDAVAASPAAHESAAAAHA